MSLVLLLLLARLREELPQLLALFVSLASKVQNVGQMSVSEIVQILNQV